MRSKASALGAATIFGLAAVVACGDDPAKPQADGEGGEPTTGGGSKSGSAATGGGAGKKSGAGGTAGRGGSAGSGGGPQMLAGAGPSAGAGGEAPCPGCESGFCLEDGTCVECLPSNDHCPDGEYCAASNECMPGCKADGGGCVSGVCDDSHNCQKCQSDDECNEDTVCGSLVCAAACSEANEGTQVGCTGDLTCCSVHCIDMTTDSKNCGGCGVACGAGQFCGQRECANGGEGGAGGVGGAGAQDSCAICYDTELANVCTTPKVIVILDTSKNPADGDRAPGEAIGAALADGCTPTPALSGEDQSSADALNFVTGRPVSGGGELLVIAGGPFFQSVEGYLEQKRISPLYYFFDGTDSGYKQSADDAVVIKRPNDGEHDTHDIFIIQFMRDPASGSLILNAQGTWLAGTVAAGYYFTQAIMPNLASYDRAWYAYEWIDDDGDNAPDLNEVELLASQN
jgi:hypothetical protein